MILDAIPASYNRKKISNTTKSCKNNNIDSQNRTEYLHIVFLWNGKTIDSRNFNKSSLLIPLDLIYKHNSLPPESSFAAIRVSVLHLILLIILFPFCTHYKIIYCDISSTLGHRLISQLHLLNFNQSQTPVLPGLPNHQVDPKVTLLSNQPHKKHHFDLFNKKTQAEETDEQNCPVITTTKTTDRLRRARHFPPPLLHNQ